MTTRSTAAFTFRKMSVSWPLSRVAISWTTSRLRPLLAGSGEGSIIFLLVCHATRAVRWFTVAVEAVKHRHEVAGQKQRGCHAANNNNCQRPLGLRTNAGR